MPDYYAMRHKVTGKIYIGCTHSYKARIAQHIDLLSKGKHTNKALQSDCDKHGISFDFFLLEQDDQSYRMGREKEWQSIFRSNDPEYGYNLCVAEHPKKLDDYPQILKRGDEYVVERRRSDILYDCIATACKVRGKDIEEVRKKCRIGKKEIHNMVDIDGYFIGNAFDKIADELGVPHWELTKDYYRRHPSKYQFPDGYFEELYASYNGVVDDAKEAEVRSKAIQVGLKNPDIEEVTGLSKSMASRWLHGLRNLHPKYVVAIEKHLLSIEGGAG